VEILLIQGVATIVQVLSCLVLVGYGFLGVSVGASTLGVVASVLGSYAFRRRLNASVDWGEALRYVLSALLVVPPVLVSVAVLPQPVFLPVHVVVGAVTYFAVVRFSGGVRSEDLEALSLLLPKSLGLLVRRVFGGG